MNRAERFLPFLQLLWVNGERMRVLLQRGSPWDAVLGTTLFTLALCTLVFLFVLLSLPWSSQSYCYYPLLWLKGLWFYNSSIKILGLFSIISSSYPFIREHDKYYTMETEPSLTSINVEKIRQFKSYSELK